MTNDMAKAPWSAQTVCPFLAEAKGRTKRQEAHRFRELERPSNEIKHCRAIGKRYGKLARNFLAAVQLVAAIILLD